MEDPALKGAVGSSGHAIQSALRALHAESVVYWARFDTSAFLAPIGDAWSPADNVRHLTTSMRALTQGLRLPRFLLLLRFGRAKSPSRSYEEMRAMYRARLALGASAGRFAPRPRAAPADPEAERARVMAYHASAVASLCDALARWPERALDARQLPHPLLGSLTVREMLLFTLYHNRHHLENVQRKLDASARPTDDRQVASPRV